MSEVNSFCLISGSFDPRVLRLWSLTSFVFLSISCLVGGVSFVRVSPVLGSLTSDGILTSSKGSLVKAAVDCFFPVSALFFASWSSFDCFVLSSGFSSSTVSKPLLKLGVRVMNFPAFWSGESCLNALVLLNDFSNAAVESVVPLLIGGASWFWFWFLL